MKKTITFLMLAMITVVSMAQESTLLRLNYNPGDKYLVTMSINQETMMSMDVSMDMEVKEVVDTIINVEMAFKDIAMDMNQNGMQMSYDSKTPEDELDEIGKAMHNQFAPMLTAIIYGKMSNRAETLETKVEPALPGMDQFSNGSGVVYPKKALKVGDSWTAEKIENGMEMNIIYTVKSIETNLVNIEISGDISLLAEGTISGNMEIDRNSGNVNNTMMYMDMNMSGQEMKMSVGMTSTKQ